MANKNVRKQKGNSRGVRIVLIVTLVLCLFMVGAIVEIKRETDRVRQDESAWQESLDSQMEYSSQLAEMNSGGLTLQKIIEIARERFGLLFPNEIIIQPDK